MRTYLIFLFAVATFMLSAVNVAHASLTNDLRRGVTVKRSSTEGTSVSHVMQGSRSVAVKRGVRRSGEDEEGSHGRPSDNGASLNQRRPQKGERVMKRGLLGGSGGDSRKSSVNQAGANRAPSSGGQSSGLGGGLLGGGLLSGVGI